MTSDLHATTPARVLHDERGRIDAQRARRGLCGGPPLTGLAISGGGIRSACFGLGVLQALDERGAFPRIDYLSTVSGGGYAGAALGWFMRRTGRFPFASNAAGSPLDFIRRQASYLSPSPRLTLLALAATVLQQMILSVFVYGSLLVAFFFLLGIADRFFLPLKAILRVVLENHTVRVLLPFLNVAGAVALVLAAAFVVSALWGGVATAIARRRSAGVETWRRNYRARLASQLRATRLLRGTLYALVVASVPVVSHGLAGWVEDVWTRSALLGVVVWGIGLVAGLWPRNAPGGGFAGTVGVGVLLYGLLLLAETMATAIAAGAAVWLIGLVGVGVVLGLLSNPNAHGSHRVYKDRLMETFLPDEKAVQKGCWHEATEAPTVVLSKCAPADGPGPYPLINASVTTSCSVNPQLRGRGSDAFLFSPLWCGSSATGWAPTSSWLRGTMTLATATAISAAAADPHTAPSGEGATRGPLASMLLAILNLRLGFLARNPSPDAARSRLRGPNLLVPGLSQNLLGRGLAEQRPWIELADGGDFENLGLYELVRRRIEVILVADASEDPDAGFEGLGNAVERVRTDFDVRITFDDEHRDLRGLLHGSGGLDLASRVYDFTRRPWAVGRIAYPAADGQPAKTGVLLYVKSALFPGLAPDVLAFKAAHPVFPHESTFNQLFDESHFEAYRELGRAATLALLSDDVAAAAFALTAPVPPGGAEPTEIVDAGSD